MVAAGHVVGHEVDDHLQSCIVGALHQLGELLHAVRHGGRQVGVHIVVVLDGIGRTCLALDCCLVVGADAEVTVVGLRGMLDDTGIPDVGGTQLLDGSEGLGGEGGELAAAVLLDAAARYTGGVGIAKQAGEDLIEDDL